MPDITIELGLARNMLGAGICDDAKAQIQALVDNPCEATWEAAHSLVICPYGASMTLWACLCEVRSGYFHIGPVSNQRGRRISGWKRIPTRDDILAALRFATH
jgi:hypothetical protein